MVKTVEHSEVIMFGSKRFKQIGIAILVTAVLYFLVGPGYAFAGQTFGKKDVTNYVINGPTIGPTSGEEFYIMEMEDYGLSPVTAQKLAYAIGTKFCSTKKQKYRIGYWRHYEDSRDIYVIKFHCD